MVRSVELGYGEFRSNITVMEDRYGARVHGCNDADELGEIVHFVG